MAFTPPKPGERRGGRQKGTLNKSTMEIRELAQAHAPAAIAAAVKLMKNAESETAKIAAITLILDRGYGKPTQPHSGAIGTYDAAKLANLTDDELANARAIAEKLAASVGDPGGDSEA